MNVQSNKKREEKVALNDLQSAGIIALETFRKNGEGVITPVWQMRDDDNLYAWTPGSSWKVKRIRNNRRVRVCESDRRGTPLSEWFEAQATIIDDPTLIKKYKRLVRSKTDRLGLWAFYGLELMAKLRGETRIIIEISGMN